MGHQGGSLSPAQRYDSKVSATRDGGHLGRRIAQARPSPVADRSDVATFRKKTQYRKPDTNLHVAGRSLGA